MQPDWKLIAIQKSNDCGRLQIDFVQFVHVIRRVRDTSENPEWF